VGVIHSPLFTLVLQVVKDFGFSFSCYYQQNSILRRLHLLESFHFV